MTTTHSRYESLPKKPGIARVHMRACAHLAGKRCNCTPSYRAEVFDKTTGKRERRTHSSEEAAKRWRIDKQAALQDGRHRVGARMTVAEAWAAFDSGLEAGTVKAAGGKDYKPGVLRAYRGKAKNYLLPRLGRMQLAEVRRVHVQQLVDDLVTEGTAAGSVKNTVAPLRVLFKWALRKELVTTNPCDKVELPSDERARDRVASRDEAAKLLAALTDDDCAVWATAFYAGLRRGELMGLRWSDVDLQARTIKVRRSYDPGAQRFVAPKTKNGRRDVGIPKVLVAILAAHKLRSTHELCFASSTGRPFRDDKLRDRARDVWGWRREGDVWVKARPDALEPIGLHEARHTYASWLIAGGANLKAISMAMGHGGIQITLDTYGHLLPGDVETTTAQLDAYLDAAGAG